MKVKWSRFFMLFALFQVVFLMCGCASLLGTISGLLPALEAAVSAAVAFVMALEGKTVPASVSAAVQKWGANIAGLIANIQTIIASASGTATSTVVSQIQAVLQSIQTNLSSILAEFDVTDGDTAGKFTSLVGLAVALIQTLLGLVPIAQASLKAADKTSAGSQAKEAESQISNAHHGMQEAYKIIRNTPTASADVNAALEAMPKSLP